MPAYQVYPATVEADIRIAAMTLEQRGAHAILVNHAWLSSGLPDDLGMLARVCRCDAERFERDIWPGVAPCFERDGGGRLVDSSMEEYRAQKRRYVDQCRGAGRRSAEKRTGVERSLNGCPTDVERALNTSTLTLTSNIESTQAKSDADEGTQWERVRWIQSALAGFMPEWSKPDVAICRKVDAALNGRPLEDLRDFLERLHASGRKPGSSWAWFVSVIGGEFGEGKR